eukprot:CAMPEP_0181178820 /NCGR_PEP_ID=MMETSP1096-20121128/5925_1 /TAXON_ID=156174 ORGANISM="Chrysochromulina ericina, Strain CCMP281" /NCGR_SAMPLE_ID=MMETSP1096 /ASSEMBLY_ACC=CAM_ASM_000453 /LENGTH=77 /DNA_ID=CAMNT_0023267117 /DNA_START=217 /DNA_END=447 /DNA_ORIENTATION=-
MAVEASLMWPGERKHDLEARLRSDVNTETELAAHEDAAEEVSPWLAQRPSGRAEGPAASHLPSLLPDKRTVDQHGGE